MDDFERQLLIYDDLPADERARLDAYLADHPDEADLLDEGRQLGALFAEAAQLNDEVPDAETIAQYLTALHFAQRPLPDDLRALGDRIAASFDEHPGVERQYSMMHDRLHALTAEAESPRAQFERLSGHTPGTPLPVGADPVENATAAPATRPPRQDRAPVGGNHSPLRRLSFPRLAVAAAALLAVLYGGLLVASEAGQSPFARLADLDTVENEFAGLRLRGADGEMDPAADQYAEALDVLRDARTSTLGLFPSYNSGDLVASMQLLDAVIDDEQPNSALALEAWFLIGKIRLYEGNVDAARQALQIVVNQQGPSAPDAQRLLDHIETRWPSAP